MLRKVVYSVIAMVCFVTGVSASVYGYTKCKDLFSQENIKKMLYAEDTLKLETENEENDKKESKIETKETQECKTVTKTLDGRVLWVGDSRTVQLQNILSWFPDVNEGYEDYFFCKGSMGYQYFVETCIPEVNAIKQKGDVIVMNMGVNDLGNIDYYIAKMNELINGDWKDCEVIYMTPNPVLDSASYVQNADIEAFNAKLENGLDDKIQYLDSYTLLRNYEYTDAEMDAEGVHYSTPSADGRYHTYEYLYNLIRTQQRGTTVCETVKKESNKNSEDVSNNFSGKVTVESNWTDIPVCENISEVKICTPAKAITRVSSEQYKLLFENKYGDCQVDNLGFYYVNDVDPDTNKPVKYYCIALGSYYMTNIGEKFKFTLSNGETIYAITSDIRQDIHSQAGNMSSTISDQKANLCVGMSNEIMEFYIDTDLMKVNLPTYTGYQYTGGFNQNYDEEHMFQGSITKVEKLIQ